MTDKRITIILGSNGAFVEIQDWSIENQRWESNDHTMVFHDFDQMTGYLREHFNARNLR